MALSITQLQAEIDVLQAAYLKLASGVTSYTINLGGTSRTVTRMNLVQLRQELEYKQKQLNAAQNAGQNGVYGLPTVYGTVMDDR